MSSFATALAELDSCLQSIHAQLSGLGAALDVNDVKLNNSLADARYHAATLRELIRAERPDADWKDRRSLIQTIGELEAAAEARRIQQRRSKLLDLADELDCGSVRHRSATRVATLDAARLEAVRELRTEAGRRDRVKDVPGPSAAGWIQWACALQEETDSDVLEVLRREFPALERFACDMEENYWVVGKRDARVAAVATTPAVRPRSRVADASPRRPAPHIESEPPLEDIRAEFDRAAETGDYYRALSLCYTPGSKTAPELPLEEPPSAALQSEDDLIAAIDAAPHVRYCNTCGGTFPASFDLCPLDDSPLRPMNEPPSGTPAGKSFKVERGAPRSSVRPRASGHSHLSQRQSQRLAPELVTAAHATPPPADPSPAIGAEVERLKNVLAEYGPKPDPGFQVLDTVIPRKKVALGAGAVVLFASMLITGYHYGKANADTLRSKLAGARNRVEGIVKDADIQKEIDQKLAAIKGSVIQATVQQGVVTLVGHTQSKWDSVHAESLALETTGVKLVENRVEILEESTPSPVAKAARRKRQN